MNRQFVVGILIALSLVNGCASHQNVTAPNELAESIARTGQGDEPAEPSKSKHPPNYTVVEGCVKCAIIGGTVCLVVAALVILSMAKSGNSEFP
jgi:hypothetical protein